MAWQTPTVDEVLGEFTPTELASITQLMGHAPLDYTTKLSLILSRVIAEIRDYIRSGDYDLDEDETTLPVALFPDAISISRWRFLVSVPDFRQLQTEERKGLYQDSITKLTAIAKGQFSVEPPVPLETVPGAVGWNSENKVLMRTHPVPRPGTQFQTQTNTYANPNAPEDTGNDA